MRNALERADRGALSLDERAASEQAESADSADSSQRRGFQGADSCADSVRSLADDGRDSVIPPPVSTPEMFYGVLGELAKQAADGTEVNPVAAMTAAMGWASAAMGRNHALAVGDDWHHPRLFTLHVGRSARGGKGTATGLLKRVAKAVHAIDPKLVPQMHTGGLSTREGLALLIHDGYREGKEEIPAIEDKRLFVVESEFANVLAQGRRDGNTLSACLRDVWDGQPIRPAIKSCRVWATRPHIALHGNITPTELRAKMGAGELTNGFANRFLIFWAERIGIIPFPAHKSDAIVQDLAGRLAESIRFGLADYPSKTETQRLSMSRQAAGLFADCYREFAKPHPGGELISGLLLRRAPMMLRIASLFALCDQKTEISREHMAAARAWMRYYADSVHMIFAPVTDQEAEALRNEDAEKLHAWLTQVGDWRSRTAIGNDCFKRRLPRAALSEALERLVIEGRIERREVDSGGVTKRTEYRAKQGLSSSQPARLRTDSAQTPHPESPVVAKSPQNPQIPQSASTEDDDNGEETL